MASQREPRVAGAKAPGSALFREGTGSDGSSVGGLGSPECSAGGAGAGPSSAGTSGAIGAGGTWVGAALFALVLAAVAAVSPGGPLASAEASGERGFALRLGLWSVAGVAWIALVFRARRRPPRTGWIVAGALLLRLVALAGDPELSDDRYRYAFEGGLLAEGRAPYALAPDAPELAVYRERWPTTWAALNNKSVSAAYPPTTQAAAALVVTLSGGPEQSHDSLRAFFALTDLLALLPLALLARRSGAARVAPALVAWGWSPLVVLEFAGAGHFDSLGILALLAALVLLERAPRAAPRGVRPSGRELLGWWTLAAAVLTKFLPLAAAPFLLRGPGALRRAAWLGLGLVLPFLPLVFLEGGVTGLTRGLSEYGLRWETTNLVYARFEPWFEGFGERDGGALDPRVLGRLAAFGLLAALGLLLWFRRAPATGATAATGALIGGFLVLTPTLHPWYLTWIVPFVALRPRLSWLALLALAPLLYTPLQGWTRAGVWETPGWLGPLLAGTFFGLRGFELWRERGLGLAPTPQNQTPPNAP